MADGYPKKSLGNNRTASTPARLFLGGSRAAGRHPRVSSGARGSLASSLNGGPGSFSSRAEVTVCQTARHSELAEESRSRQQAARMNRARFLGKLGMTFFFIQLLVRDYLSARASGSKPVGSASEMRANWGCAPAKTERYLHSALTARRASD